MLDAQLDQGGSVELAVAQDFTERANEIQAWLLTQLAELVKVKPGEIDPRQPFVRYGLGSAQGLELAAKLEDWIGFRLPPTLVWDYPSIETVSWKLAEDPEGVSATADYPEEE
jgi:acyl carrier protein